MPPPILDWYGCATFRLRRAGLTVFLDAYIDRVPAAQGTGLTADDIEACDWLVIGHSHFDHLWGAERIIANTSATLIGSYESVRLMEEAGVPSERLISVGGGERIQLAPEVTVTVLPSQHSCAWSVAQPSPEDGSPMFHMAVSDEVCLGDLGLTWQDQQERMSQLMELLLDGRLTPEAMAHFVESSPGHSPRGDGGAFVYLFEMPEGSLLYQDTCGYWTGIQGALRPDVAILAGVGRGNIDGEPVQGSLADFLGRQVESLRPRQLLLCHHDDWMPGFSTPTAMEPLRAAVAAASPQTELLEPGYLAGTELFAWTAPAEPAHGG